MTWVTGVTGDITSIIATDGLTTPDGTAGDVTIGLAAGVAGDGLTLTTGVLDVNIATSQIEDNAVTSPKLALFDDNLAATDTHMLIANGTDFFNKAMSGDATIANTGAITIADNAIDTDKILNDAVTADKLADSINTDIAAGVAKVSFPGFGNTTGLSLEGDTTLLALGTSGTTALAGDTPLLQLGASGTTALAGNTALLALGTSGTTALAGNTDLLQVGTLATEALAGNTITITTDQATKIAANDSKVSNATHTGDVTGSGLLTIVDNKVITSKILDLNVTTAKIADNAVNAAKLNVTDNGTAGDVLSSDGDGSFSWVAAGGGYTASYVTSALTSWTDNNVYVFTNTADLTHTLPASPSVGTSFKMSLRSTSTNTLGRNGNSIMGDASDLVLDDLTAAFELFFAGGAQGWVIIGAN